MATNKNQHFVPRCHLRPFTLNAEDAAISLFNLDRKRLVPNAPVKNQCAKDYFYGTDETLEDAIQLIESGYGQALRSLLRDSHSLTEENKTVFKTFWIFQHLRTEAAAKRAVELAESTRILADLPPGEFSLSVKEAVQLACRTFVDAMHNLDDLKFCIVKNKTKIPFITSDNPAVLTNRWQLDNNPSPGLSFGMGSAGMVALLPLTPKLLFVGYDGDVYSVPNERGIVEIRGERDAIALNRHQFLQCVANVYVHDAAYENSLVRQHAEIESARPKVRHVVRYAQIDRIVGGHTRYVVVSPEERDKTKRAIMHSSVIHPHPGIWPSQIRIRRNGSVYTNGSGAGYVRLSQIFRASSRDFWRERV
ncbi:DUF4238 domain-containing protein [Thiobacillus sp.]|uniref:DUF4238 domain-containing protein n=1 Tax=Thiobacillus sp. TaxID=924 RepID=UPI0017925793|nr:DUF4238 domain-containing protein [Thiobacillus sp.]MBC2730346.1 DUF4238 domain-containing protein [Thiobacillus sp.]MBC2739084.1 DUF4238 domain-containing protein [Thiobacillus sp.]MBC2760630.1 DUF4238 domain-containing protein [Thiobacillus sp.]